MCLDVEADSRLFPHLITVSLPHLLVVPNKISKENLLFPHFLLSAFQTQDVLQFEQI